MAEREHHGMPGGTASAAPAALSPAPRAPLPPDSRTPSAPDQHAAPGRMAKTALAALLAVALLAPPAAGLAALAAGPDAGLILVLAPPWADLSRIVAEAGGRPIGPRLGAAATLAASSDPDFPSRLSASGAWLALDGDLIAQLCGAEA